MLKQLILLTLLCAAQANAQIGRVGEVHSFAIVDRATGRVEYYTDSVATTAWAGEAILGLQLNRKFYSNAQSAPLNGELLPSSVFSRSNDTLISTWTLDDCILKQIVYPYQTGDEYKIVTRYFAT